MYLGSLPGSAPRCKPWTRQPFRPSLRPDLLTDNFTVDEDRAIERCRPMVGAHERPIPVRQRVLHADAAHDERILENRMRSYLHVE